MTIFLECPKINVQGIMRRCSSVPKTYGQCCKTCPALTCSLSQPKWRTIVWNLICNVISSVVLSDKWYTQSRDKKIKLERHQEMSTIIYKTLYMRTSQPHLSKNTQLQDFCAPNLGKNSYNSRHTNRTASRNSH
jgi:hypothetical protein